VGDFPEFDVQLDSAPPLGGAIRWKCSRIPARPQETTENSVGFGYFTRIHGLLDGWIHAGARDRRAPRSTGLIAPLLRLIVHRIVCKEVDQDLDVWTYKTYQESPALAKGDGPIAEYRRYAQQFYVPTSDEISHTPE
jgi:hypothetical protein